MFKSLHFYSETEAPKTYWYILDRLHGNSHSENLKFHIVLSVPISRTKTPQFFFSLLVQPFCKFGMKHSSILIVHMQIIFAQSSSHKWTSTPPPLPPAPYCLLQVSGGFLEDHLSPESNMVVCSMMVRQPNVHHSSNQEHEQ
jgi:hypothetical protein